ncbi:hypothetical protein HK096_009714 [Nowakowskiella sp. JEL0078]|nr:hypothetical protein HK096_009714 [Nowakowskiella sp. JEL0078]
MQTSEIPELLSKKRKTFQGIVNKNERLTSIQHFQDVRHFEINVNEANMYFVEVNYVFVVRPQNLSSDVEEIIDFFNWKEIADIELKITPLSQGKKF